MATEVTMPLPRGRRDLDDIRALYAQWLALPPAERDPPSQAEFARRHGCSRRSLAKWSSDPAFGDQVFSAVRSRLKTDYSWLGLAIAEAQARTALGESAQAVSAARLLLELVGLLNKEVPTSNASAMVVNIVRQAPLGVGGSSGNSDDRTRLPMAAEREAGTSS